MRKVLFLIMVSLLLSNVVASEVNLTPNNVSFNIFLNQTKTFGVSLLSDINASIYDEITFTGSYLMSYTPVGGHLDNGTIGNFTLTVGGIQNYERTPEQMNLTVVTLSDSIVIKGFNDSGLQTIGTIQLTLNLSLPEIEEQTLYFFKKCFIDNEEEFCTNYNISELQNVTVENITIENVTYAVTMPYDLTIEFLEKYEDNLVLAAESMVEAKEAILLGINESIKLQDRENNAFSNALYVENYLKNENNELWSQISPENLIINATGLTSDEFMSAMQILIQYGKITQESKTEMKTYASGSSIITREVTTVSIASTERLEIEDSLSKTRTVTILSLLVVIIVILILGFYLLVWKRRVK